MTEAKNVIDNVVSPPPQFLVITDEQSQGIGRNNNAWFSPPGGLWFTYCLKTINQPSQVSLVIGNCLYITILEQFPHLLGRLKIKWPNDLLIDGRKLAGILINHYQNYLIVGVGINTNITDVKFETKLEPVSLKIVNSFHISNIALLNNFLLNLQNALPEFSLSGMCSIVDNLNANLYGKDNEIAFNTGKEIVSGTLTGISEDGAIVIRNKSGNFTHHYSGSILSIIE